MLGQKEMSALKTEPEGRPAAR